MKQVMEEMKPGQAACQEGAVLPAAQGAQQQLSLDQLQKIIRDEVLAVAQRHEPVRPHPPMQPMQLIINNHAESSASQKNTVAQPLAAPQHQEVSKPASQFFASLTNRACVYTVVGIGLYILQGHLNYKWRVAETQRRVDANLPVRILQFFGMLPAR